MVTTHRALLFALSMALGPSALAAPPAAGVDDSTSSSTATDSESKAPDAPKKSTNKDHPDDTAKLKSLREERERVMEELLALEEGYSKLAEAQTDAPSAESPDALEERLQARLTLLQTRLDTLDLEIAAMMRAKGQR